MLILEKKVLFVLGFLRRSNSMFSHITPVTYPNHTASGQAYPV